MSRFVSNPVRRQLATEQSLNNALNNVLKHYLLLNQHAADGSEIISEAAAEKTNMFVLYLLNFLCAKSFVVKKKQSTGNTDVDGDVKWIIQAIGNVADAIDNVREKNVAGTKRLVWIDLTLLICIFKLDVSAGADSRAAQTSTRQR